MNKVFLGLVLAVCVLGMALVMLNERLGRRADGSSAPEIVDASRQPHAPAQAENPAPARELADSAVRPLEEERQQKTEPGPAVAERSQPDELFPKPAPVRAPEPAPASPQPAPIVEEVPQKPVAKPEAPKSVPAAKPEPRPAPQKAVQEQPSAQPQSASRETAAPAAKTATRFVIFSREKGATVRLGAETPMEYSSMTLEDPNRVVVDLPGDWKFPPNPGIPKNELVSAVRVGKNGSKTRVVIDLKDKPRKVILVPFKDGKGVDVRVDK